MFSFFHPKPVVDGRPVAVKIVQHKALAQQDMRTLVLATPGPTSAEPAANDARSEK